ncbi:putative holin-like toxin [Phascolarctobacterium sp. ET69]
MVGSSQCRRWQYMSTYEALSLMIAFGILVATIISGKR